MPAVAAQELVSAGNTELCNGPHSLIFKHQFPSPAPSILKVKLQY